MEIFGYEKSINLFERYRAEEVTRQRMQKADELWSGEGLLKGLLLVWKYDCG